MSSAPRTREQDDQIAKLREDIRRLFQLEKAKPEMTALIMGEERENVLWEEAEEDLSLAIARYVVLDLYPIQSTNKGRIDNNEQPTD